MGVQAKPEKNIPSEQTKKKERNEDAIYWGADSSKARMTPTLINDWSIQYKSKSQSGKIVQAKVTKICKLPSLASGKSCHGLQF